MLGDLAILMFESSMEVATLLVGMAKEQNSKKMRRYSTITTQLHNIILACSTSNFCSQFH